MKKPIKIGDLVMCEWRDAHCDAKQEATQDEVNAMVSYKFKTYGILARNDIGLTIPPADALVAIAAEVGDDNRYRGVTYIPAEMVVVLDLIKSKTKPRKAKAAPKETPPALAESAPAQPQS